MQVLFPFFLICLILNGLLVTLASNYYGDFDLSILFLPVLYNQHIMCGSLGSFGLRHGYLICLCFYYSSLYYRCVSRRFCTPVVRAPGSFHGRVVSWQGAGIRVRILPEMRGLL